MKQLESTPLNMFASLTGICLVVGGILAGAQLLTAEPIRQAEQKSQQAAIQAVLPEYATLQTDTLENGMIRYRGYDNRGRLAGTAIQNTGNGFGGPFTLMTGFRPDGTIVRYQVLQHSETPGLGSKMEDHFQEALSLWKPRDGALSVKKDGGTVDAITAATVSSRAFLAAVNQAAAEVNGTALDATTSATVPQAEAADTVAADTTAATQEPVPVVAAPVRQRTVTPQPQPADTAPAPQAADTAAPVPAEETQADATTSATAPQAEATNTLPSEEPTVEPANENDDDTTEENGDKRRRRAKRKRNSDEQ